VDGADSVDLVFVNMYCIKISIVFIGKIGHDATRDGQAHSENVDHDEDLILGHAPESDQEVIFYHMGTQPTCVPNRGGLITAILR
jgi:hypothetical protein